MNIPFVDLHRQYLRIKDEIDATIASVIKDSAYIGGQRVKQFEAQFAAWLGIDHVIACANGTDSIEILLDALGVGPGDEVIVPALSWISTAEAVGTRGATPVFMGIDHTYCIDPEKIEGKIRPGPKASSRSIYTAALQHDAHHEDCSYSRPVCFGRLRTSARG